MIRILVVDDHVLIRKGIRQVLSRSEDFEVTAEAGSAHDAVQKVRSKNFDVVLLDISLPGRSGLDALKEIKKIRPRLPVLILSMHPEEQFATRALKTGASGYLTKDTVAEELMDAVRKVAQGEKYITRSIAEGLVNELRKDPKKKPHELLSNREYQILCFFSQGMMASQIAQKLSLSAKTIATYRSRLLQKMGMKNNAQIIKYAISNKLID